MSQLVSPEAGTTTSTSSLKVEGITPFSVQDSQAPRDGRTESVVMIAV
jgi:hypothetical protein